MTLLSIIIPAYNVEPYILQAVRSALAQTIDDFEVIVVDDGSTDDTAAKVMSLDDARLKLVRQANRGLAGARNSGIRAAQGKYIGFLDGDDMWLPQKARCHLDLMESDPAIGITYCHSTYIDQNDHPTGAVLVTQTRRPSLVQMIRRNVVGNGSTPIVRKECFGQAGLFDESLRSCEDWEMWVRILRDTSFSAELVPQALTCYRINLQSLSMNFDNFLIYAEKAAAKIARESPAVPARVIREGLSMAYRIAATKALYSGNRSKSLKYMTSALRKCPWLPLIDPRTPVTFLMMALPLDVGLSIRNMIFKVRSLVLREV